ncbi:uncharacterized mitochondrial protein-like protein [Tanacetum coccineum]
MDYIKLLELVYVDDIIFGLTNKELCNAFEKLMHEKFQMISMGELTFFLGLQVQQKKDGVISQDKYVGEIRKKFRLIEVKTASTPMETQNPLLKDEAGEEVDVHMYRYLKGQPKLGIWYPKDSPFDLVAYTDSDYAGASLDMKKRDRVFGMELELMKVNAARHNLLLLVEVNAARHNLLLLLEVNAARHNLLLLLKVNAARQKLTTAVES